MGQYTCTKKKLNTRDIEFFEKEIGQYKKSRSYSRRHTVMHTQSTLAFSNLPNESSRSRVYLGWEWECFWNNSEKRLYTAEHIKSIDEDDNLLRYINPREDHGEVELVSVPATLNWHKQHMEKHLETSDIYTKGINLNRSNTIRRQVGIHVHVDQRAYNEKSLRKLMCFFAHSSTTKFLECIAQRSITGADYNYRSSLVGYKNNTPNITKYTQKFRSHIFHGFEGQGQTHFGRRNILCIGTSKQTLEFRLFKTSNDISHMYKNLEFCDAITRYMRICSWNTIGVLGFISYIDKRKTQYPHLDKFIKENYKHG